jgi:hypothetical protein
MAATKRNFRKKSRSNRRKRTSAKKGGKKCSMGGKKCSMGGKKYSRRRRGGAEGDVTLIPYGDDSVPKQVRTWSSGCLFEPTNFVQVLFSAIEDGRVNVVSLEKEAAQEPTIITRDVYSRTSPRSNAFLRRNEACKITDTTTREEWMAYFLSWPSGAQIQQSFPMYMYFYMQ